MIRRAEQDARAEVIDDLGELGLDQLSSLAIERLRAEVIEELGGVER